MSKCIAKTSCPECDSSDGVQIFEQPNGKRDAYCYACDTRFNSVDGLEPTNIKKRSTSINKISVEDVLKLPSKPLTDRRIRQDILDHFGVKVGLNGADKEKIDHHFYPTHSKTGELMGYKQRICATKDFYKIGTTKGGAMFGQHICPSNKKLFVAEGEIDAMALYQVLLDRMQPKFKQQGYLPSVVGITTGVQGATNQLLDNTEFLSKFKEVIIVFDNDDPGRTGAEKVAKSLEHKVLLASLPLKDAGEMLKEGQERELYGAVLRDAMPYEPDGIVNASTAWERYKERKSVECHPYPKQFKELNEKTYGWRFGSVVTVTSGSGMGKTSFMRELVHDVLVTTEEKVAIIALEEDIGDSIEGLMAIELNKRIQLPDVEVTDEEEHVAFDKLFKGERVEMYDHFGGMDDADLFSRIKYFNTYLGCRVLVLDHLSIVISEAADQGDERRRIDAVMTKLAKIAKTLDIVIFLVVHLRKAPQGKSFEEGHVPTSDDLRGSGSIKQLSWDVVALSRNQQDPDVTRRNTSGLHVLKCRFTGRTGPAGHVLYDETTGRMNHTTDPDSTVDEFEEEERF